MICGDIPNTSFKSCRGGQNYTLRPLSSVGALSPLKARRCYKSQTSLVCLVGWLVVWLFDSFLSFFVLVSFFLSCCRFPGLSCSSKAEEPIRGEAGPTARVLRFAAGPVAGSPFFCKRAIIWLDLFMACMSSRRLHELGPQGWQIGIGSCLLFFFQAKLPGRRKRGPLRPIRAGGSGCFLAARGPIFGYQGICSAPIPRKDSNPQPLLGV